MEEKKKRWRPSLAQYREMERKLEEQIEGTSRIVQDCDGWREKYRKLVKEVSKNCVDKVLKDRIDTLERENDTLSRSNEFMASELNSIRKQDSSVARENQELRDELFCLKNRGFFARLFNKNV